MSSQWVPFLCKVWYFDGSTLKKKKKKPGEFLVILVLIKLVILARFFFLGNCIFMGGC